MNKTPLTTLSLSKETIAAALVAMSNVENDEAAHVPFDTISERILDAACQTPKHSAKTTVTLKDSEWVIVYGAIKTVLNEPTEDELRELREGFPTHLREIATYVENTTQDDYYGSNNDD